MTNKLEDSFFYIPDTARDPAAPPRYFVATPDDEDGNYSINAVFDNKADAVEYIAEFKDWSKSSVVETQRQSRGGEH
jgi:hypothetical protein